MEQIKNGWIQTFTGKAVYVTEPKVEDISIVDIAHALSNCCRFTGHVRNYYSVAQHCVLCARQGKANNYYKQVQLALLLHDASEAYLVDVPSPIKPLLKGYYEIEQRFQRVIEKKFGLDAGLLEHPLIKEIDMRMLMTEKRDLLGPEPQPWQIPFEPYDRTIVAVNPFAAEKLYLDTFRELTS